MGLCSKTKNVRTHELAFMSAYKEGAYENKELLDAIYKNAEDEMATDQIFEAKNDQGDHAISLAAKYGNPTCLKWVVEKYAEKGVSLDIDLLDYNGFTPLYLVCFKGYLGAEKLSLFDPQKQKKRIEIVRYLIG